MPERIPRSPKPCRVSSRRRIKLPKPRIRGRCKPRNILTRSLSDPCLWNQIQFLPSPSSSYSRFTIDDGVEFNEQASLLRPHTFTDGGLFSSAPILPFASPLRPNFMEEAKVVVSVTVERSPGPVRAMVKLGATIDETIGVVIDRYNREGRSPKLDLDDNAANFFQLHHSHFSLQSLNKSDKIGEVGSRNFYLRTRSEGRDSISESEVELLNEKRLQTVPSPSPAHIFFSFIARRLSKIKRRTKSLWRVVACISCV